MIGYEAGNYVFVLDGSEKRLCLRLASATETLIGAAPVAKRSLPNGLLFARSPGYCRLFSMADEGSPGRITRAILLSASEQVSLKRAVAHRPPHADEFCATLADAGVTCTVFPKNFGVTPELRVRVNRKDAFVRVGGMVQEVLPREASDGVPPKVAENSSSVSGSAYTDKIRSIQPGHPEFDLAAG